MKRVSKSAAVVLSLLLGVVGLPASASAGPSQTPELAEQPARTSGIDGTWYNQLGSKVVFKTRPNGDIVGLYQSAVGNATGEYRLVGRYHLEPASGGGTPLGWTVVWLNEHRNSNSVTTWSGQYRGGPDPVIITSWLLTNGTAPADDWRSTMVGQDRFTRTPPTAEQIQQAREQGVTAFSPEKLPAVER